VVQELGPVTEVLNPGVINHMLTLFTFGYWGWGNATRELIRVVDAKERKKGFKPPIFFDIRYSRNVRAKGFRGNAFERLLPRGRYRWFPRLGNSHIATGGGIKIADPYSARILLEEALRYAKDNRRVILFCACPEPCKCHRRIVANLVLKEATRIGREIRIVEWPGGAPLRTTVRVNESIYEAVSSWRLANVPLRGRPRDLVCLPWGSIVDIESGKQSFPIMTGPAEYHNAWLLPIWEQCEPSMHATQLRSRSEKFCKRFGYRTLQSPRLPAKPNSPPKGLTIRQPWAHAIIHLGKDVENRSWRTKYRGPLLIHASAHQERDPRSLLMEHMARPPSQKKLRALPTGTIIGVADLFDCFQASTGKWTDKGQWHWLLRDARPIKPVKCTGRLGLWTPGPSVMKRLPGWVKKLDWN
jgi:hypothetical protein